MAKDVESKTSESAKPSRKDITFECPMCGKAMVIGAEGAGEVVICPSCDQEVIVPGGPLWHEVMAEMETSAELPSFVTEQMTEKSTESSESEGSELDALLAKLRTLENQLKENKSQRVATAEAITHALNQATRFKLSLQRLEERQVMLEGQVAESKDRIAVLEKLL